MRWSLRWDSTGESSTKRRDAEQRKDPVGGVLYENVVFVGTARLAMGHQLELALVRENGAIDVAVGEVETQRWKVTEFYTTFTSNSHVNGQHFVAGNKFERSYFRVPPTVGDFAQWSPQLQLQHFVGIKQRRSAGRATDQHPGQL